MMNDKVALVFRSKRCGAFSIESFFGEINKHFRFDCLFAPRESSSLINLAINCAWFMWVSVRYRVVHVTGDMHYIVPFAPRRNVVLTALDTVILTRGSGLKRKILKILWFDIPCIFARRIVSISNETKAQIQAVLGRDIDISVIRVPVRGSYTYSRKVFNAEMPRILHVGVNWNKNLPRVVAALNGVQCVLVVVGRINEDVKKLLEGSGLCYELHDRASDEEVLRQYHNADIVSFPSLFEGFGVPILEGQSVGRVVVTSNREPMLSVANGGAIFVDPEDVDSIRAGFVSAINDSVLRDYCVDVGKLNVCEYSSSKIAEQYLEIYRSI